jgi:CRP-like cAMP-binding protein
MWHSDFFAFCTALKPAELKAIKELSWARSLAAGAVLYSPGEPGNALYIITQGLVEAQFQKPRHGVNSEFLGRGDVIGDIEALLGIRRTQLVRAQETSSVHCFPRANFAELLRLVPSFYQYLCAQMAYRLLTERELALEQTQSLELSGRISNFDLTTIYQTVVSSGQTGELSIKHQNAEPLGAFYFESGRLCAGQFQHLVGEEAFWQLFLSDKLSGTFSFSVGKRPLANLIESGKIRRHGGDMLITALQFQDELHVLKRGMPSGSVLFRARTTKLNWDDRTSDELREVAQQVLQVLSHDLKTVADLYLQCNICELKLYRVVAELLRSEQICSISKSNQLRGETVPATTIDLGPTKTSLGQR